MTNKTIYQLFKMISDQLMHVFDDPPSSINPSALDGSFHTHTNYILGPTLVESPPIQAVKTVKFARERQSLYHLNQRRSSRIVPERSGGTSNDATPLGPIKQPFEAKKIEKLTPIVQEDSPRKYRGIQDSNQTETMAIASPMNRLYSGSESLMQGQSLLEKKPKSNSMMVYYLIKRFLTKISVMRRQKLFFRAKHFEIVDDMASEAVQSLSETPNRSISFKTLAFCCGKQWLNRYVRLKNRILTMLTKLIKPIPLVYPQAMGKIIWDLVLCFVLMYFFVVIPIQIFFQNNILFVFLPLTILFIIFLLCDYLLKLNTIYYEYGKPVTDRMLIFERYMKSRFIIDGMSIAVLVVSLLNYTSNQRTAIFDALLICFYSQFHYFSRILSHTQESLNLGKVTSSVLDLLKLIFTILFSEHLFSCLWYWIAAFKEERDETNWMRSTGIQDEPWENKYLNSFYFSTVTMLSVGYGDIVPTNALERVVSIVFMLFACIQLSYSVNTVGEIINNMNQQLEDMSSKMRTINNYMNANSVSFGLQYQVREYLRIYWQQQLAQETQEEEKILGNLSEGLRNKLIFEANNTVLHSCPLFRQHFSLESKVRLLKVMKQVVINPETVITSQLPQIGEPCLCFVQSGQLEVCLNQQTYPQLGSYGPGQHFGLDEFITGQPPTIQMSSQSFVKLIVIVRSEFIKSLPTPDYEEFCMLKDQYYLQIHIKEEKCLSCNCVGHDIQHCPIVHFTADRERVIKSYQFATDQSRSFFQRNKKRAKNQFNAVQDQWAIQEISMILQNHEEQKCHYYDKINHIYQLSNESPSIKITRASLIPSSKHKPCNPQLRLQRAVRKVIRMLKFHPSRKHKLTESDVLRFNANIQAHLKRLKLDEEELVARKSLGPKELEDMHFLLLRMDIEHIDTQFSQRFEVQKNFDLYLPQNNLDRVIDTYDRAESELIPLQWRNQDPANKSIVARQRILRGSLIHYMLYPHEYFKRFCKPEESKQNTTTQTKRVRSARLLFQSFKKKNEAARLKNHLSKMKLITQLQ